MNVVIFAGPTIGATEARRELDAEYLPPAAEGDVYRAARRRPRVIGIIDGYFERVPSVWHKEVLWAMSHGIHVFGSASMGALRAAELEAFGMEGVGSIFEAYRDGTLEDDDEVAVVHGGAEYGFRSGSEAMVDIRCTIGRAVEAGIVDEVTGAALCSIAKSLFYPDRNYRLIGKRAVEGGLSRQEVDPFLEWLPQGRASQKHDDAVAMLRVIRERIAGGLEPKVVAYSFENSAMWEQAWRLAGERFPGDSPTGSLLLEGVLDELRLEGEPYLVAEQAALLRCMAISHSYVQGLSEVDPISRYANVAPWRRPGIPAARAREEWMSANNLDEALLAALQDDEARVRWISGLAAFEARAYILDHLRMSGQYPALVERARAKGALMSSMEMHSPTLADVELTRNELLGWYFKERLGRPAPPDIDAYARSLGFDGLEAFERSVLREYLFVGAGRVTMAPGV